MKVYLISGAARNGKDTIGDFLEKEYINKNKKVCRSQISKYIKMYAKEIAKWDGDNETKPRQLLQDLGTELIRKQIDEYFFIKRIIQDIDIYSLSLKGNLGYNGEEKFIKKLNELEKGSIIVTSNIYQGGQSSKKIYDYITKKYQGIAQFRKFKIYQVM